jgi:hypothetical protein
MCWRMKQQTPPKGISSKNTRRVTCRDWLLAPRHRLHFAGSHDLRRCNKHSEKGLDMTATASTEIVGLKQTLKDLNKLNPAFRRQLTRDFAQVAQPVVNDAKSKVPTMPLSGWKYAWTTKSGATLLPWDSNKHQRKLRLASLPKKLDLSRDEPLTPQSFSSAGAERLKRSTTWLAMGGWLTLSALSTGRLLEPYGLPTNGMRQKYNAECKRPRSQLPEKSTT